MGRGKVKLKRIESTTSRQVTFSKRKNGILKKSLELSILCDADIALIIFSPSGKPYCYASDNNNPERILARYRREVGLLSHSANHESFRSMQSWKSETEQLERSVEVMEARLRHLAGEDISSLGVKDLKILEGQLKIGAERIRNRTSRLIAEKINELKTKQRELQEDNSHLQKILRHDCSSFDFDDHYGMMTV